MKSKLLLKVVLVLGLSSLGFSSSQSKMTVDPETNRYTFHVNVTSRDVTAINYQHRSGATKVDFAGTDLMPGATGQAKVESKKGYTEVEVEFAGLNKPTTFGGEYLTYILWAISPEGRAINLGEIIVGDNHRSKLDVTTDLQAFALVVTAEPYYAVRQPSNLVVIENVVRKDTKGSTEVVNAKYELLERGGYIPTGYKFDPVVLNSKLPLEFFEARNALRIAQSEGADKYASDSYQRAVQLMDQADGYATRKSIERKPLIAVAREAVQTAEDSRQIAVTKIEEERQRDARQASTDAQAASQANADNANRLKRNAEDQTAIAQSESATAKADMAEQQADASRALAKSQAETSMAKSEMEAKEASSATALANAQAEANTAASESAKAKADLAASQAASASDLAEAKAEAERSHLAALDAQKNADQAITEKAAMRARLSEQLNTILQTRDTARGLIVNMSGVLFDTGKYALKPGAREKLSKVAGILLAYPGLNIAVGGYTDNVGSASMNQSLSENRASSVRDYLVKEGVASSAISSKGYGESLPVASNDVASGRQQNRRVELLVSGESIGITTTTSTTTGSLN